MDDTQVRLRRCFAAVFPRLAQNSIEHASMEGVAEWDSVAGTTLMAAVEEEFGFEIDVPDMAELTSFPAILAYLRGRRSHVS